MAISEEVSLKLRSEWHEHLREEHFRQRENLVLRTRMRISVGWAGVECSVDLAQEELGRELFKMMFASSAGGIMWFFLYIYKEFESYSKNDGESWAGSK